MQDFQTHKRSNHAEQYVYMVDENKAAVEGIRVCRLILDSDFVLDLDETLYVPSFRRNLISILLDSSSFTVTFGNEIFSLFSESKFVGIEILIHCLYKLNFHASYSEFLHMNNISTKQPLIKENSYSL